MRISFDYVFKKPDKNEKILFNPYAFITPQRIIKFKKNDKESVAITHELSSAEYESYIDLMIKELLDIKSDLKKEFDSKRK